jgi:hypothetical protein
MSAASEFQAEDAVRDVLVSLREAWERGDGGAYAALFSEDAQYVTAPGKRLHGRKSIAESHQEILIRSSRKRSLDGAIRTPFDPSRRTSFWWSPPVQFCFPERLKARSRQMA